MSKVTHLTGLSYTIMDHVDANANFYGNPRSKPFDMPDFYQEWTGLSTQLHGSTNLHLKIPTQTRFFFDSVIQTHPGGFL
jgi:hypothetical protein